MIQFSDSGTCRTSHHSALWFEWVGGQGKIHKWHQLTEQIRFRSSANLGHLVCHLYSVSTGIYSCYVLLLVFDKLEKPVSGQQALQIISGLKMLGWQLKGRNGFDSSILHKPMVMLETGLESRVWTNHLFLIPVQEWNPMPQWRGEKTYHPSKDMQAAARLLHQAFDWKELYGLLCGLNCHVCVLICGRWDVKNL